MPVQKNEKGVFPSLWDSLSSLRFTIGLLIVLALASIFGTIIPQNGSPEEYLRIYKVSTYRILSILGFLDMYHAGWFIFLLALLSLNLIACSWRRFRVTWRFFRTPGDQLDDGQLKAMPLNRKLSQAGSASETLARAKQSLSGTFAVPRVAGDAQRGYLLFAEKQKLSRLGVYFIHLSVLVILAGALIGSYLGFRGNLNIVEGETANRAALRGEGEIPLGFTVRLDQFNVSFYPSGAPKEFKSTVTILEGNRKVLTEPILVNHPLSYKGVSLYQSSYGIAQVEKAVLSIKDRDSGQEISLSAPMGVRTPIPGSVYAFLLGQFLPDFQGMGPAFQVFLFNSDRPQANFWIFRNYPELEEKRGGRYRFAVQNIQPKYYSGLQVTKDPGVWVVWVGCFLMLAGFYMTFFMSHRRIWVKMTDKGGEALLEMSGSSHRDRLSFEKEFDKIFASIQEGSTGREKEERKEKV